MTAADAWRPAWLAGQVVADLHAHFDIRRDHPGLMALFDCEDRLHRRLMTGERDANNENCYDASGFHGDKVPDP